MQDTTQKIERYQVKVFKKDDLAITEELPKGNVLYFFQDWDVVRFCCPCGCDRVLNLPVAGSVRDRTRAKSHGPVWDISLISLNSPSQGDGEEQGTEHKLSLYPSIRNLNGCRSHFFIKENTVRWC